VVSQSLKEGICKHALSYAPLEDILAATAAALSAHGLVLVSGIEPSGDRGVVLSTRLMHASGQWIESCVDVGRPSKMQEMGSSLTYARRYAITGLLGISADDDDDANAADGNAIVSQTSRQRPPVSTNGHVPDEPRPTVEQIDALFALAESCQEPKEVFGTTLRRIMGLSDDVRITKRLLRETMTMQLFEMARTHYEQLLRWQVEDDVPDGTPPDTGEVSTPAPVAEAPIPDAEVRP
jgi:ERF superfamily protein